jgi:4-hydroxy-3-methylbut-2-enyl diphosphate reductase IspH
VDDTPRSSLLSAASRDQGPRGEDICYARPTGSAVKTCRPLRRMLVIGAPNSSNSVRW